MMDRRSWRAGATACRPVQTAGEPASQNTSSVVPSWVRVLSAASITAALLASGVATATVAAPLMGCGTRHWPDHGEH